MGTAVKLMGTFLSSNAKDNSPPVMLGAGDLAKVFSPTKQEQPSPNLFDPRSPFLDRSPLPDAKMLMERARQQLAREKSASGPVDPRSPFLDRSPLPDAK